MSSRANNSSKPPHYLHPPASYLYAFPILIAVGTISIFSLTSDPAVADLWIQCANQTSTSHPALPAPACTLVAFFRASVATDGARAFMAVFLSFVAVLLTICTFESARISNQPSRVIRNPTLSFLLLNVVSGAVIAPLVLLPAFVQRSRHSAQARTRAATALSDPTSPAEQTAAAATTTGADPDFDPNTGRKRRHLRSHAEIYAVPASVAIGYILPSAMLVFLPSAPLILLWQLFPVYVFLLRYAVLYLSNLRRRNPTPTPHHLESNTASLVAIFALPVGCSVAAQLNLLRTVLMGSPDDMGSAVTRAALFILEIDFWAMITTMVYWLLVEAGLQTALEATLYGVLLGPGAGLCLGWVRREQGFDVRHDQPGQVNRAGQPRGGAVEEERPLLSGK